MNDKFILGSAAGFAGSIVMGILTWSLNALPGINAKLTFGPSLMFVSKNLAGTYEGNFIGAVGSIVCGTLIGVGFLMIFEKTGYHHFIIKDAILGVIAWFLLCGVLNQFLGLRMEDTAVDNTIALLVHVAYGVTAAWVLQRFREKPLISID